MTHRQVRVLSWMLFALWVLSAGLTLASGGRLAEPAMALSLVALAATGVLCEVLARSLRLQEERLARLEQRHRDVL